MENRKGTQQLSTATNFEVSIAIYISYREEFFSEVKEFNRSYDLTGAGVQYREEQVKRKVSILEEELEFLETGQSQTSIKTHLHLTNLSFLLRTL